MVNNAFLVPTIWGLQRYTGPIVRITPTELHIRDPLFYNQMFVSGSVRKSNSYDRFTQGTGFEGESLPSEFAFFYVV